MKTDIVFRKIRSDSVKDLDELSELAHKIWNDHYPDIIGQKQVDYMLNKFYSGESLSEQINIKNNIFTGAYINDELAGFLSHSVTGESEYFIHKLYVNTEMQRKGIGRDLFVNVFGKLKQKTIRLTVNRQNFEAVNFYFRLGFTIEKTTDIDIGNGFLMNDFIMIFRSDK